MRAYNVTQAQRLSDVLRELYFYEVRRICLTPEYSPIDRYFPWEDEDSINDRDLQILYYIGTTHRDPDEAARGGIDMLAVSHSYPYVCSSSHHIGADRIL